MICVIIVYSSIIFYSVVALYFHNIFRLVKSSRILGNELETDLFGICGSYVHAIELSSFKEKSKSV